VQIGVSYDLKPIADPGPEVDVGDGSQVALKGTANDPDGDDIATYEWKVIASPPPGDGSNYRLDGANTPTPVFQPLAKGLYSLSFQVTDSRGLASDTAEVLVRCVDASPLPNIVDPPGANQSVLSNQSATFTGTATDYEGDAISYQWSMVSSPNGAIPQISG